MLSGCQNASLLSMVTERINSFQAYHQNLEHLQKVISKETLFSEILGFTQMAQQSLVLPANVANRTQPPWLLPQAFQLMNFELVLNQMQFITASWTTQWPSK